MKYFLCVIFSVVLLNGWSSLNSQDHSQIEQFMNQALSKDVQIALIENSIAKEVNGDHVRQWKDIIEAFNSVYITSNRGRITELMPFPKEELQYMADQAHTFSLNNWSELSVNFKNNSKNLNGNLKVQYSIPVFNRQGNIALILIKGGGGADVKIYEKINGSWVYLNSAILYLS